MVLCGVRKVCFSCRLENSWFQSFLALSAGHSSGPVVVVAVVGAIVILEAGEVFAAKMFTRALVQLALLQYNPFRFSVTIICRRQAVEYWR